ncbi:hypothetical protein BKA70DRAFT_1323658, partial [Coprinopsis sp. MPI-PUGE-AT-0042]
MTPFYRLCAALLALRLAGATNIDAMAADRPHTPVATPGFSPNIVTVPLWGQFRCGCVPRSSSSTSSTRDCPIPSVHLPSRLYSNLHEHRNCMPLVLVLIHWFCTSSTPTPTTSCGPSLGCSCLPGYTVTTTSHTGNCSRCGCVPGGSSTSSTRDCPHPPRCTCPPGYTLTSTSTGTACPWCSCSFTSS